MAIREFRSLNKKDQYERIVFELRYLKTDVVMMILLSSMVCFFSVLFILKLGWTTIIDVSDSLLVFSLVLLLCFYLFRNHRKNKYCEQENALLKVGDVK